MEAIKTILKVMNEKSVCINCQSRPTIKGRIIFKCCHVYCKKCATAITDENLNHCPSCFSSKNQQWERGSKAWFHDACSFFSRTLIDEVDLINVFTRVYCESPEVKGDFVSKEVKLEQKDRKLSKRKLQEVHYVPTYAKKLKNEIPDLKINEKSIYGSDSGSDINFLIDPIESSENATRTVNLSANLKISGDSIPFEFNDDTERNSVSKINKENASIENVNRHKMITRKKMAQKPSDKGKITNYSVQSIGKKSFLRNASTEKFESASNATSGSGEASMADKTLSSHHSCLEDSNESLIDRIQASNNGSKSTARNPTIGKPSNKLQIANINEKSKTEKSVESSSHSVTPCQSEATLNEYDVTGDVSGRVKPNHDKTFSSNYLSLGDFNDSIFNKSETSQKGSKTKTVRKSSNRSKITKNEKPVRKRKSLSKSSLMNSYLNLQPKLFEDSLEITNDDEHDTATDSFLTSDKSDIDKNVPIFIDLTFDHAPGKTYSRKRKKSTDSGDSNFDKMFGEEISEILKKEKEKNVEKLAHGTNKNDANAIPKANVAIESADLENNNRKQVSITSPDKRNTNNCSSRLPCLKTDAIEIEDNIERTVNTDVKESEKENIPVKLPLKSILKCKSQFDASRDLMMKSKLDDASSDSNALSESNEIACKKEHHEAADLISNEGNSLKLFNVSSKELGFHADNIDSIENANSKFDEKETHSAETVLESVPKKSSQIDANPGTELTAVANVDQASKVSNNLSVKITEKSNKGNIRKVDTGKLFHELIPTSNISDGDKNDTMDHISGDFGEGNCGSSIASTTEKGLDMVIKYPELKDKLADQEKEAVEKENKFANEATKNAENIRETAIVAGKKSDDATKKVNQLISTSNVECDSLIANNVLTEEASFKKRSNFEKNSKLDLKTVSSLKGRSNSKLFDDSVTVEKNLIREKVKEFSESITASKKCYIPKKKPKLDVKRGKFQSNFKPFDDPLIVEKNLGVPKESVKEFGETIPSSKAESYDTPDKNILTLDKFHFHKRPNLKMKPKLDVTRGSASREQSGAKSLDNPIIAEKNLDTERVKDEFSLLIPASNVKTDSFIKNAVFTDEGHFYKRSNYKIRPKLDVRRVNTHDEKSEPNSLHYPITTEKNLNVDLGTIAESSRESMDIVENIFKNFDTNSEIVNSFQESADITENTSKNINAQFELLKSSQESINIVKNTSKNSDTDVELVKSSLESVNIVENTPRNLDTDADLVKSSQEFVNIVENTSKNLDTDDELVKSSEESLNIVQSKSKYSDSDVEIVKSSEESVNIVENTPKYLVTDVESEKSLQEFADIVENTSKNLNSNADLAKSSQESADMVESIFKNISVDADLVTSSQESGNIFENTSENLDAQSEIVKSLQEPAVLIENASKNLNADAEFVKSSQESVDIVENTEPIIKTRNLKRRAPVLAKKSLMRRFGKIPRTVAVNLPFDEFLEHKSDLSVIPEISFDEISMETETSCNEKSRLTKTEKTPKPVEIRSDLRDYKNTNDNDTSKEITCESLEDNSNFPSNISKLRIETTEANESESVVSMSAGKGSRKKESACEVLKLRNKESEFDISKMSNKSIESICDISITQNKTDGKKESASELIGSSRIKDVDEQLRGIVRVSEAIMKTPITRTFATPGPSNLRSDGFVEISEITSSEKKRMDSSLFSKENTLRGIVADNDDEIISCDDIRPLLADDQNIRTPNTDSKTNYTSDGFGNISEITISEEKGKGGSISSDDETLRQRFSESPKELWDVTGDDEGIRPLNDEEESEDIIVNTPKASMKTVLRDSRSLEKTKKASLKLKNSLAFSAHSTPYPEHKARTSSSSSSDFLVHSTPYSVQKDLPKISEEYSIKNTPYLVLKSAPPYLLSTCFVETKKANKLSFSSSSIGGRMKEEIHKLASIHGIEYSDEVSEDTTHLIVIADEEKRALRTYKYLQALSNRIYIVTTDYVVDCLRKNRLLDEALYIPLDLSGHPGPICAALGIRPLIKKLRYFNFYVVSFQDTKLCSTEEFKGLLKKTGACVYDHLSQLIRMNTVSRCRMVLAEKLPEKPVVDSCKENEIMIVDIDWFTEALGRQRLPPVRKTIYYFPDDEDYRRQLSKNDLSELLESDDEADQEDD